MAKILKAENIQTDVLGSNGNSTFSLQRNNSSLLTFSTSDNVGIGTTSPTSKLQINGGSEVELRMDSSAKLIDAGTRITFVLTNNSNFLYEAASIRARNYASNQGVGGESSYLSFYTKYIGTLNEVLRIDRDGNIILKKGYLISKGNQNGDDSNVAIGYSALYNATYQAGTNTAVGTSALNDNRNGSSNVAVGYYSLFWNRGSNNVGVGYQTLFQNTAGEGNVAVGFQSINNNLSGCGNIGIGSGSLFNNKTSDNIAIGTNALVLTTNGSFNVAVGTRALSYNITSSGNVGIGYEALSGTVGFSNTAIGNRAGHMCFFGDNNIFIGRNSIDTAGGNNASNTIILGNTSHSTLRCNTATISAISDVRDKKDIQNLPVGLNFINDLRPVKFIWNQRDRGRVGLDDLGFIAQESLETVNKYNADWMGLVDHQNPEHFEMSPGKLIPVLVKAMQELKHDFDLYVSGQALKT